MWKLSGKIKKEQWLLLILAGAALMLLSMPGKKREDGSGSFYESGQGTEKKDNWGTEGGGSLLSGKEGEEAAAWGGQDSVKAAGSFTGSYEVQMEGRIKEILKSVDGVGEVDVMVVLKSSEEKVIRVDQNTSSSVTKEQDSGGGQREISQSDREETTIMTGTGGTGQSQPVIEKEICPEISGIIISASGGGSPQIKAEISEAMEALFGLPAHKIKVLKRVE